MPVCAVLHNHGHISCRDFPPLGPLALLSLFALSPLHIVPLLLRLSLAVGTSCPLGTEKPLSPRAKQNGFSLVRSGVAMPYNSRTTINHAVPGRSHDFDVGGGVGGYVDGKCMPHADIDH